MRALLLCAAAAGLLRGAALAAPAPERPQATVGPYRMTLLLPPAGLYAGEEMEIEFRVERLDRAANGADGDAPPLLWARIRGEVDMPSMPAMPRFDEIAHREDVAGIYGVHPTFPHGGSYRLCLTVLPPEIQPVGDPRPTDSFTFEFPLDVHDAAFSPTRPAARVHPFSLDLSATPAHPAAGEPVDLELTVRQAGSLELREIVDFDLVHERPMHVFIVRSDLTRFSHEHPEPAGRGVFRLRHVFPAPGLYRIFVEAAPKDAGAQMLSANLGVSGAAQDAAPAPAPTLPILAADAGGVRVVIEPPDAGIPAGRTVTVTAALTDRRGRPVTKIEPWLGALGHLMLIHQDGETFAHAHPDERERSVGRDGRIPFLVRLPKPGLYRGWLQFQTDGAVRTAEIVLSAVNAAAAR